MGELYGEVNPISQEWRDGLASKIMREASLESKDEKTWVVFDGPVDALWIENMNTVLDDNMTLCLANGQRIKLRPQMRMLFEVQDLSVASPATVSRCGMVYMTPEDLGWRPYVQSWIPRIYPDENILNDELKSMLYSLFDTTVDFALDKIRSAKLVEFIKTVEIQRVASLCNFLEVLLQPQFGFKGDKEDKKKNLAYFFGFAYIWGIGASLDAHGQERVRIPFILNI
jgi:dynein heavy chain